MMYAAIVCSLLATCVLFAGAVPIDMFYPFRPQNGDRALRKGFMERSERIRMNGGFNFLGSRFYNVWVSIVAKQVYVATTHHDVVYNGSVLMYSYA